MMNRSLAVVLVFVGCAGNAHAAAVADGGTSAGEESTATGQLDARRLAGFATDFTASVGERVDNAVADFVADLSVTVGDIAERLPYLMQARRALGPDPTDGGDVPTANDNDFIPEEDGSGDAPELLPPPPQAFLASPSPPPPSPPPCPPECVPQSAQRQLEQQDPTPEKAPLEQHGEDAIVNPLQVRVLRQVLFGSADYCPSYCQ
uniref:Uncharacterized protein n=1 Tax=Coccolithus braarudii TaxID=221442 RepID=A0A7S0LE45_9EUKA